MKTKSIEPKKLREYIVKIMGLCHDLNETKKYTVFVDYAGHVNQLQIRIYKGKWTEEKDDIFKFEEYFNKDYETPFEENAKKCIMHLKSLLKD